MITALLLWTGVTLVLVLVIAPNPRGGMFDEPPSALDAFIGWLLWKWWAIALAAGGYLSIGLIALAVHRERSARKRPATR
jgi:hypothetical protein